MIKREIRTRFRRLSETRKVVLLTGARQVGKSTLVKSLKEADREYITLDDLQERELAQNDPRLFLMQHTGKIIIDEIQYAPQLLPFIKMDVDNSDEKGKYWLTGSQKFELMKGVSESLAGRVAILEMSSLSFAEKQGFHSHAFNPARPRIYNTYSPEQIFASIWQGGMPEYVSEDLDRDQFFNDYVSTYLERDVRNLSAVGDLLKFRQFIISVAARNGEVLNYASICDDAGITAKTAKSWISILQASDIIYLLQPYMSSELKRATKSPKIVFMDTGLCAFLCNWSSPQTLMNSSVAGHYLEAFITSELIKNRRNNPNITNYELYYYRDRDGKEVDLLMAQDGVLYPFEIKKTASPNLEMLKNFTTIKAANPRIQSGGLLSFYPKTLPLDGQHNSYPISSIF